MLKRCLAGFLAIGLFAGGAPVMALERILSYHSAINIAADASMVVQEDIRVVAEGNRIRRGIYREFPTTYRDKYGNAFKVEFEVLEVKRDGTPEPWHIEKRGNGVRIYAGSADVFLSPGNYEYTIIYQTNRQIGFFDDHDELYWNVSSNGWDFIIDRASATVTLPQLVSASDISMGGYTGLMGAKGDVATFSVAAGSGAIETRGVLNQHEGLTLVMGWPKGVVREPGAVQKVLYVLKDNLGLLLSLAALGGSVFYLSLMWSRYGRDPQPGVLFPHYEPPAGYSPASARYINRMKYDDKVFAAAVINLAVKGPLLIACDNGDYTLKRKPSEEALAAGEAKLIRKLFTGGSTLKLENSNHQQIAAARRAHKIDLQQDYRTLYFKTNGKMLLLSLVPSLLLFGVILSTGLFSLLVFVILVLLVSVHALFLYLLKAPSQRGRRLMDKLGGFKLYLEVAEKDDLNLQHPPELTPHLFEKYLPFAVALGVEQEWAERFSDVFARLQSTEGTVYSPAWYHGNFNYTRMGSFTNTVSSQFSSAISSAARAPGSSSGGGSGGFSGGGGGGGGGGGW